MRPFRRIRLLALAGGPLLLAAGCAGFDLPTPELLERMGLPAVPPGPRAVVRHRVRLNVESPWLTGEFEGVIVARRGSEPAVRAQFFPDLGQKAIDLLAKPDRIVGYFPIQREGVDCALPGEAARHPLLFIGASLLEDFADLTAARVRGAREEGRGWRLELAPVAAGPQVTALYARDEGIVQREYRWGAGVGWEERRVGKDDYRITAPRALIHVRVLQEETVPEPAKGLFELTLPADVRITGGSRK